MPRLIDVHPLRQRIDLNGLWSFQVAKSNAAKPPKDGYTERQPVPGVWETCLAHYDHRGQGWYRRTFTVRAAGPAPARLVFEAVSHTAKVWLDGRYLGEHYGAHNQFTFTIEALAPGDHELTVWVDNTFGPRNPLSAAYQDIYTWGGITRPVYVELLPACRIVSAAAIPRPGPTGWDLHIDVTLDGDALMPRSIDVSLDGRALGPVAIDRHGRGRAVLAAGKVAVWSCETPRLYTVRLDAGADAWQERVGFRTVTVKGRQILLNGKPIALNGVNRHEFHPDFGPAVPAHIHLKDIEILKKLGANYVRGSHYPNDDLWLDLCDEHGLLFWEELSHWQPKEEHLKDPVFRRRSLEQATEMVLQHRHHPCVFTWGFLNEADSHLACARPVIKELVKRITSLDDTRPTTFASHKWSEDKCFDLVDIISINIYPGWYWSDWKGLPDNLKAIYEGTRDRSFGKPIIVSEFGAGGMRGVRSFEPRKWTEDYQGMLIRYIISQAQDSGYITGVSIWQYCDVRTSSQLAMGRIREYNNKGIVTEYREPKAAFAVVQEVFTRPWKVLGVGKRR